MKKRAVTAAAALIVAAVGFIYSQFGGFNENSYALQTKVDIPQQITDASKEGIVSGGFIDADVTKVVDGDTINIEYKKKKYIVRLLDVDTPESKKSGVPVQPYADEASEFTKKYVADTNVKLVFDKDLKDRYDRLLAYVILKDGTFLNAQLVRGGYAITEIIKPNNSLADYFNELQEEAIKDKSGFWNLPEEKRPFIKNSKGVYSAKYLLEDKAS